VMPVPAVPDPRPAPDRSPASSPGPARWLLESALRPSRAPRSGRAAG